MNAILSIYNILHCQLKFIQTCQENIMTWHDHDKTHLKDRARKMSEWSAAPALSLHFKSLCHTFHPVDSKAEVKNSLFSSQMSD